jgi:hypothetical protein
VLSSHEESSKNKDKKFEKSKMVTVIVNSFGATKSK